LKPGNHDPESIRDAYLPGQYIMKKTRHKAGFYIVHDQQAGLNRPS
jgi:hypothetical protein